MICNGLGTPTIDRFATRNNTMVRRFNSYFYEEGTEAIDAFSQSNWLDEFNFCHPPFALLGRLTNFLTDHFPSATCLIIAPYWTGAPWFLALWNLVDSVYLLPGDVPLFWELPNSVATRPYALNSSWRFILMTMGVDDLSFNLFH